MSDVVWLGGGTCCSKTTVARVLADRLGRQLYSCDDQFDRHVRQARLASQPSLYQFEHDAGWNARVRALRGVEKAALWLSFARVSLLVVDGTRSPQSIADELVELWDGK